MQYQNIATTMPNAVVNSCLFLRPMFVVLVGDNTSRVQTFYFALPIKNPAPQRFNQRLDDSNVSVKSVLNYK